MRFVKNDGAFLMSVDSAVLKFYHFEEGKCMLWEEKIRKKKKEQFLTRSQMMK